jgi:hypothetical protein
MNRVQLLRSKIGDAAKREWSLALLLPESELPGGGWQMLGQVSLRMGIPNRLGDISRRCRKSGQFMALRRFRQPEHQRGLFVQVGPYVSDSDAADAVARLGTSDGGMRWPGVTRLAERAISGVDVRDVSDVHVWELETQRSDLHGYQRSILGRVHRVVVTVSGSAGDPGWDWQDLVTVTSLQATRIRLALAESGQDGSSLADP